MDYIYFLLTSFVGDILVFGYVRKVLGCSGLPGFCFGSHLFSEIKRKRIGGERNIVSRGPNEIKFPTIWCIKRQNPSTGSASLVPHLTVLLLVVLLRRGELLGCQEVVLLGRGGPRGLIRPLINIFLRLHLSKYSIFRKNHIGDIPVDIRVTLFVFRSY